MWTPSASACATSRRAPWSASTLSRRGLDGGGEVHGRQPGLEHARRSCASSSTVSRSSSAATARDGGRPRWRRSAATRRAAGRRRGLDDREPVTVIAAVTHGRAPPARGGGRAARRGAARRLGMVGVVVPGIEPTPVARVAGRPASASNRAAARSTERVDALTSATPTWWSRSIPTKDRKPRVPPLCEVTAPQERPGQPAGADAHPPAKAATGSIASARRPCDPASPGAGGRGPRPTRALPRPGRSPRRPRARRPVRCGCGGAGPRPRAGSGGDVGANYARGHRRRASPRRSAYACPCRAGDCVAEQLEAEVGEDGFRRAQLHLLRPGPAGPRCSSR